MLATNFMTAADLKITETERQALIQVLHNMEMGEYVDAPAHDSKVPNGFNMARVREVTRCGTVACIYGWARTFTTDPQDFHHRNNPSWDALFMPDDWGTDGRYTLEDAKHALRTYLVTGTAEWK